MDRDDVDLQKIDGKENLADPFTKAIAVKEFDDFKSKMGIRYCTRLALGQVGDCWKQCPKANRQPVDGCAPFVLVHEL